jgi:hypothetical protein
LAVGVALLAVTVLRSTGNSSPDAEAQEGGSQVEPPEQVAHIAPTRLEGALD